MEKSSKKTKMRTSKPIRASAKGANARSMKRMQKDISSKKEPIKFAQGLGFRKLFFIFLIGSVLGAIYEDLLIYFRDGVWMLHRGVIYGPFNVIYGFGAVVMCLALLRKNLAVWQIFLYSALLGGVVEYLCSYFQELVVGTVSWDYSHQLWNINGRTTIPIMIVWGFAGVLLVKMIYPFISSLIERIPMRVGEPLFVALLIFMIFNIFVSWTAVLRQTLRHHDVPAFTPMGRFYDDYYSDDFLKKYYPNMVRTDGK